MICDHCSPWGARPVLQSAERSKDMMWVRIPDRKADLAGTYAETCSRRTVSTTSTNCMVT